MKLIRWWNVPFLWVLLCLAACGGSSNAPEGTASHAVAFRHDVAPIFAQSCVYCHHTGSATAIDFTHPFDPAMGIIGRPNSWMLARASMIVDPGNLSNSFLIDKVERTDLDVHVEGNHMPWGPPRVTAEELAAVRQWVMDGAMDDQFFQDNIATLFGDGKSLGAKGGKCSYCHYENTFQLPDLTHPFDKNVGVVVDTHVTRLSQRLGLTRHEDAVKIERDLMEQLPQKEWIDFSHRMIWHGRRICKARRPLCGSCVLEKLCPKIGVD